MPMRAVQADITMLPVDAVVNAANEGLAMGSGVCGAIFRAAGAQKLAAACQSLAPCPTGEARTTPGFNLPARWVIHVVGPRWQGGGRGEAALLESAYRSAMAELARLGGRSIAFPAISTGVYAYPKDQATRIAVRTLRDCLRQREADVTFACFDVEMLSLYQQEIAA
jgi:O-acetyl-ADP-ribose deacetylase (regulator of RNase III)